MFKLWITSYNDLSWHAYWTAPTADELMDEALRQIARGAADSCRITGPNAHILNEWNVETYLYSHRHTDQP